MAVGGGGEFRLPVMVSPSTMTIIQTPTLSSEPRSGVQWIQRDWGTAGGAPVRRDSGDCEPALLLERVSEVRRRWRLESLVKLISMDGARTDSEGTEGLSQEIFAVTPMPSVRAFRRPCRTFAGPTTQSRNLAWRRPGRRNAGEVNVMRNEGYGRTRRYCENQISQTQHTCSSHNSRFGTRRAIDHWRLDSSLATSTCRLARPYLAHVCRYSDQ